MRVRRGFTFLPVLLVAIPAAAAAQVDISARAADIRVGGRVQAQIATSSVEGVNDDAFIRRARLLVDVSVGDFVSGRLQPDFAGGETALQDAYVRLNFDPAFRLSLGQFKRPFSGFELASSTDLPIIERDGRVAGAGSCAGVGGTCSFSRLTERLDFDGRDMGLKVDGTLSERVSYQAGVTNGEGINTSDVNDGKSFSGRLVLQADSRVALGFFGGSHDYVDAESDETERAGAVGADVEIGTWRSGFHALAAVTRGSNWAVGPEADFTAFQAMVSYYAPTENARVEGVEPLFRLSWGDPDSDSDDDAGVVFTPGLMLYFSGKTGISTNVDIYRPSGDGGTEWSFKLQTFFYF